MEIIRQLAKIDTTNKMTVAYDVSKDKLNYYSEVEGKISASNYRDFYAVQGVCKNGTLEIISNLNELKALSIKEGFSGIHIVCEPTGNYSNLLLRTARNLGNTTAYVGGEVVHKAKVIENNDNGKDDVKDPRIIYMLSKMGKELTYRTLAPEYKALRELNRLYDQINKRRSELRCRVHHYLVRLFPDFPMCKDFLFHTSGQTLNKLYGFNPGKISGESFKMFSRKMKKNCTIWSSSLVKIYEAAQSATLHQIPFEEQEVIEQSLQYAYEDYVRCNERKAIIRKKMEDIYDHLARVENVIPIADEKVFQPFYIARILGETGPLSDFNHLQELLKFGGLNLRKRESGYYKGKLKMSKKGRAPLRGIVGSIAFKFVKKKNIYGEYYHTRKEQEKISGTKLLANVERKIIKMLWGMAKNREAYNPNKFRKCESQYGLVA